MEHELFMATPVITVGPGYGFFPYQITFVTNFLICFICSLLAYANFLQNDSTNLKLR